jgi:hypothetical protein
MTAGILSRISRAMRVAILKMFIRLLFSKRQIRIAKFCIHKQWYKYGNVVFFHSEPKPLLGTFKLLADAFDIETPQLNYCHYDE